MRRTTIAILGIILLSIIIATYLYPLMPEQMASHWNAQGEVDDYLSKFWALFLMPIVSIAMLLFFILIPIIDPLRKNIEKFRKHYEGFMLLMVVFLFYLQQITIAWNLGYKFKMIQMIAPALGILFYYIGILLEKSKQNWFIGIRTPWTLSSKKVWDKTHKIGSKLFRISGVLAFIAVFFEDFAIWLIIVPVIASALYLLIYSYFEYTKITNK